MEADERRKQEQEKLERAIHAFKKENFGRRYVGASFARAGSGNTEKYAGTIQEWWEKGQNFLVLMGPPGTGKTWICAALAELAFRKYNTIRYWKEEMFFTHLRDAIGNHGDYINTLKLALDDELTFLDDIGSTPPNDWRKEVIFNALDHRYNEELPTIITTNLTEKQIEEKYEPRVADRLFASQNTIIALWGDESLRKQGL